MQTDLRNFRIYDIDNMNAEERRKYYSDICESLGLNPLTKPFDFIQFPQGGTQLYALRSCTDQLRAINCVSVVSLTTKIESGIQTVTCVVRDKTGREDQDIGAVVIAGLSGDRLANAIMKGVTKAKRRATLSLCGLGWLDESELDTVPAASKVIHLDEPKAKPEVPAATIPVVLEKNAPAPTPAPAASTPVILNENDPAHIAGEIFETEGSDKITKVQILALNKALKKLALTPSEMTSWKFNLQNEYGCVSMKDLSVKDADEVIDSLDLAILNNRSL